MRETLNNISTQILKISLPLTAFLVPIFFLPNSTDFFSTNKQLLLSVIASVDLLAWSVRHLTRKQLRLTIAPATIPLLFLFIVYLVSTLIQSQNKVMALMGRTSTIFSLVTIFLTTSSTLTKSKHTQTTIKALGLSLAIASFMYILQFLGVTSLILKTAWLNNKVFNVVGGPLPFITISLPTLITFAYLGMRTKEGKDRAFFLGSALLMTIASIMAISQILPKDGQPQIAILPLSAGWAIALDIFKNARTGLLGVGPESFVSAFSALKPAYLNRSDLWSVRFSNSSNEYLHVLTTVGLLGFLSYTLATFKTLTTSFRRFKKPSTEIAALRLFFLLLILVQLLVPVSTPLLTVTFVVMSLISINLKSADDPINDVIVSFFAATTVKADSQADLPKTAGRNTEILPWIVFSLSVLLLGSHGFFKVRTFAAENTYYQSLKSAEKNDGTSTYNYQIKAITLNPNDAKLRMAYSQTNLALANSLSTKTDLSDQDRTNITQLIQQAIREAKVATVLEPQDSATWANLANIYRQLINIAQGSDQWSIAAYTQAIATDPLNAQLRLDLGGVYYALNNYDQAIRLFTQATEAKPDWANAYFNLAAAYKGTKQYQSALQAMRVVTQLIEPTSADYQKAQDELAALESLSQNSPEQPTPAVPTDGQQEPVLNTPSPLPTPAIEPIELPAESGFQNPAPEATPSAQ